MDCITSKHHSKLLNLIGKRCYVNCKINNIPVYALWDTGSQVSIINEGWRQQFLPHAVLRSFEELLRPGVLYGKAANETEIPLSGWVEVTFRLTSSHDNTKQILVPLVVSEDDKVAEKPIIGYNVIEEIFKETSAEGKKSIPGFVDVLRTALDLSTNKTEVHVNSLQANCRENRGAPLKTDTKSQIIPSNSVTHIRCIAHIGTSLQAQNVLFTPGGIHNLLDGLYISETLVTIQRGQFSKLTTPVWNTTKQDIVLPGRTRLGCIEPIKTAYPAQVKLKQVVHTCIYNKTKRPNRQYQQG